MKFLAPKTYYVYTYAFPDGTVFYVGKGTKGRIDEHEKEASKGCRCQKCTIIHSIWESGKPVRKRIEYETLDESDALEQELALIRVHAGPYLTNIKGNQRRAVNLPGSGNNPVSQDQALDQSRLIDVKTAASRLRVHPATVLNLISSKQLKAYRVGRVWRIREGSIERYLDSNA